MKNNLNYRSYQQVLRISGNSIIKKKPIKCSKRSFLGCIHCKRKKIKCDETKPICKNCIKSRLACVFPNNTRGKSGKEKVLINKKSNTFECSFENISDKKIPNNINNKPTEAEAEPLLDLITKYPLEGLKYTPENLCFYSSFIQKFVPSIAQPYDRDELTKLFISASLNSPILLQVFIACGATILSFENESYKAAAHKKYLEASDLLLMEMKTGSIRGYEDWFFIAIQVMQSISLRNKFIGANANRCALHLEIANKIMTKRLDLLQEQNKNTMEYLPNFSFEMKDLQFSIIDKVFRENYIFNYALAVFFGDYNNLELYAPNPFQYFKDNRNQLCPVNKNKWYETRIWKSSNIAFEIAAKCSWSCRFKHPLPEEDIIEHQKILLEAQDNIQNLEQIECYTTSKENKIDITIAKLVTRSSIILLKKILNYDKLNANHFQQDINKMINDIDKPYNNDAILPGFSLMIASSASISEEQKNFFKRCLNKLVIQLNSNMILQILNYIKGVWELYDNGDAFELLFNTDIMSSICN